MKTSTKARSDFQTQPLISLQMLIEENQTSTNSGPQRLVASPFQKSRQKHPERRCMRHRRKLPKNIGRKLMMTGGRKSSGYFSDCLDILLIILHISRAALQGLQSFSFLRALNLIFFQIVNARNLEEFQKRRAHL